MKMKEITTECITQNHLLYHHHRRRRERCKFRTVSPVLCT